MQTFVELISHSVPLIFNFIKNNVTSRSYFETSDKETCLTYGKNDQSLRSI